MSHLAQWPELADLFEHHRHNIDRLERDIANFMADVRARNHSLPSPNRQAAAEARVRDSSPEPAHTFNDCQGEHS